MKAIIQCYTPEEIERIARGEQTVKVCKTAPKETPFKVYMYETQGATETPWVDEDGHFVWKGRGKVAGDYVCERVDNIVPSANRYMINNDIAYTNKVAKGSCLYFNDLKRYLGNKVGRALHITAVKFYDEPKELGEFRTIKCTHKNGSCSDCKTKPDCIKQITRPPQGWQYVEELQ